MKLPPVNFIRIIVSVPLQMQQTDATIKISISCRKIFEIDYPIIALHIRNSHRPHNSYQRKKLTIILGTNFSQESLLSLEERLKVIEQDSKRQAWKRSSASQTSLGKF